MSVGHIIDFSPDGQVQAMHNDRFNLGFLGNQSIERASEIKFNETTQTWGIWLHRGDHHVNFRDLTPFNPPVPGADGFTDYERARQVEVKWLNLCRRDNVSPVSDSGLKLLQQARGETMD